MNTPAAPQPVDPAAINAPLARTAKSGAHWLYWIAGMSLLNQILQMSESDIRFAIGLGITDVIQAIGKGIGPAFHLVGLALDVSILATLVALGFFAAKLHRWAFVVGLVIVLLDTLLLLGIAPGDSIVSIAFHLWAGFSLWTGFRAARQLRQQIDQHLASAAAPSPAVPPVLTAPPPPDPAPAGETPNA